MIFKKTILKNGLKLITAPLKETKAVTVLVLLPAGSRYEKPEINGASHFIEHMMFKGTKKRPNTLAISKELDGVGASYNAFTGKDHTGYYVKIDAEKVELAMDILSDILFNSKFDAKEMDKERRVIVEEIKMYEENPLMYIDDWFEQTIFAGSPLGPTISGAKETVAKMEREKILDYKDTFYRPSNLTVAVAGNFEEKNILSLMRKYFGRKNNSKKARISGEELLESFKKSKFRINQNSPRINFREQKVEQVQLALGFPCYSYFHPDIDGLSLLGVILGGNMSSRLFIQVRERRGLAYFVTAGASVYQDTGNFAVYAGLDAKRLPQAIRVILAELKKVKEKGVSPAELKRAKDFLHGKMILSLEDSGSIAGWCGNQELLTGRILTLEEKLEKINRVTAADIKHIANEIIKLNHLNMALIGPFKDKDKFLNIVTRNL